MQRRLGISCRLPSEPQILHVYPRLGNHGITAGWIEAVSLFVLGLILSHLAFRSHTGGNSRQ